MRYIKPKTLMLAAGLALSPWASQAATYGATAIVAQSGGDYLDPISAMADVSTWCGTPAETNRCLIKIMPGSYDISGNVLVMQDWVDVLGSGEHNTLITGSGTSYAGGGAVLVHGANSSDTVMGELTVHLTSNGSAVIHTNGGHFRDMTVSYLKTGGGTGISAATGDVVLERVKVRGSGVGWMQGVYAFYGANVVMRDVDVSITPSTTVYGSTCIGIYMSGASVDMNTVNVECLDNTGQNNAIRLYGSNSELRNVTAKAIGDDETAAILVRHDGAKVTIERSTAIAINKISGGSNGQAVKVVGTTSGVGGLHIRNSTLSGTTDGLLSLDTSTTTLSNSVVSGGVNVSSGTVTCSGNSDDSAAFYASTCP